MSVCYDFFVAFGGTFRPSALKANFTESTFWRPSFPSLRALYAILAVYSETSPVGLMSITNLSGKKKFRSGNTYSYTTKSKKISSDLLVLTILKEEKIPIVRAAAKFFCAVFDSREKRSAFFGTPCVTDFISHSSTCNNHSAPIKTDTINRINLHHTRKNIVQLQTRFFIH